MYFKLMYLIMFVKKRFIFNLFLFGKYMYNVNLIRNEFVVFLI